jgi:hypothetical protein
MVLDDLEQIAVLIGVERLRSSVRDPLAWRPRRGWKRRDTV